MAIPSLSPTDPPTPFRTALRWLEVAEGVGLVDCDRSRPAWRWIPLRR